MKNYTITIDTGTTNTRVYLFNEKYEAVASAKSEIGVRITAIDGNNNRLKAAIKGCLEDVLKQADITYDDVKQVAASGMITSNVGLTEIPHVVAPVSAEDLAKAAKSVLIEDVCPLPILFIPGVKNRDGKLDLTTFESMDMMRGEEVETVAVIESLPKGQPYLLVLPGSHTKFVSVDRDGKITGCLTTITGELLSVITNDTLIADAVGHSFASEETYAKEYVLAGYETARKTGIGRACFSARILNTFAEPDKTKIASYVLGAVLQNDMEAVKNSSALKCDADTTVVIYGKNPLREALIKETGAQFKHVAYDGAAGAITDLLGEHIDAVAVSYAEVANYVESGDLKVLAVMNDKRLDSIPDVPTCQEAGYNVVLGTWRGLGVPKDTPDEVVDQLYEIFSQAAQSDAFVDFMNKSNNVIDVLDGATFEERIKSDLETYTALVTDLGLKVQ